MEMVGTAVYGLGIHLQKNRDFGIAEEFEFTSVFLNTIKRSLSGDELYDLSLARESNVRMSPLPDYHLQHLDCTPTPTSSPSPSAASAVGGSPRTLQPSPLMSSSLSSSFESTSSSSTANNNSIDSSIDGSIGDSSSSSESVVAAANLSATIDAELNKSTADSKPHDRMQAMLDTTLLDSPVEALRARVIAKIAAQEEKLRDTMRQLECLRRDRKKYKKQIEALEAQYKYQQDYLTAIKSDLLSLAHRSNAAASVASSSGSCNSLPDSHEHSSRRKPSRQEQIKDIDSDGEEGITYIEYEEWQEATNSDEIEEEIVYVEESDDEGEELIEYEEVSEE
jgi:hypothetical protein